MGFGIRRTQWRANDFLFGCSGVVSRGFGSIVHIASFRRYCIYYFAWAILRQVMQSIIRFGDRRDRQMVCNLEVLTNLPPPTGVGA